MAYNITYKVDFSTLLPSQYPPIGAHIIGVDIDGKLKQMDSNGVIEFVGLSGATGADGGQMTGGTANSTNGTATYYDNLGGSYTVSGYTIDTDTNTFVTGGTFTESASTITLTRNDDVNIDVTGITTSGGAQWFVKGNSGLEMPFYSSSVGDNIYTPETVIAPGGFFLDYDINTGSTTFSTLKHIEGEGFVIGGVNNNNTTAESFPELETIDTIEMGIYETADVTVSLPSVKEISGWVGIGGNENLTTFSLPSFEKLTCKAEFANGNGENGFAFEENPIEVISTPLWTTVESENPNSFLDVCITDVEGTALLSLDWFEDTLNSVVNLDSAVIFGHQAYFNGNTNIDNADIQSFLTNIGGGLTGQKGFLFSGLDGATSLTFSGAEALGFEMTDCTGLTSVNISSFTTLDAFGGGIIGIGASFNSCTGLTSVTINAALATTNIDFYNCNLSTASVDAILASLDNGGVSNGQADLSGGGNSAPTGGASNTNYDSLVNSKGWSINITP